MNKFDNFPTGLAVGAIVPVLGYIAVTAIFQLLQEMNIMDEVGDFGGSHRMRTVLLLAICTNLIPFNIFKNRRMDTAMRGIVFPTVLYVGFWLYKYHHLFI